MKSDWSMGREGELPRFEAKSRWRGGERGDLSFCRDDPTTSTHSTHTQNTREHASITRTTTPCVAKTTAERATRDAQTTTLSFRPKQRPPLPFFVPAPPPTPPRSIRRARVRPPRPFAPAARACRARSGPERRRREDVCACFGSRARLLPHARARARARHDTHARARAHRRYRPPISDLLPQGRQRERQGRARLSAARARADADARRPHPRARAPGVVSLSRQPTRPPTPRTLALPEAPQTTTTSNPPQQPCTATSRARRSSL